MSITADAQGTINGISNTIFSFADKLVTVAADAFAPRLNAQGDLIFGPENTALPITDQGTVILAQPAQSDRFTMILIIGGVGLVALLLFSK